MVRLVQTFRWLSQRPEARHVGILTSGTIVAQIILLGTAPLLARLYTPAQFGVLAALLTISTIGGSIGGLCYEVAIILPRSRRVAEALYSLSLWLSVMTATLVVGFVLGLQSLMPSVLGMPLDSTFYLLCFASTVLTTQFNILGYAHSRATQYRAIAISKINQTLLPTAFQVVFGALGWHALGLLLGRALGMLGTVGGLVRGLPRGFRLDDVPKRRFTDLMAAARRYRDFLLQVPRQLLVRGATTLPSVLLLAAYGPVPAGLYFFAARLVERPGMLLGDALSRVPMKQFAERRKNAKRLTRASLLYTAAVGIPVILGVLLLVATAHPLFRIGFGKQWEPAADYAVVLGGWAAIRLASLPMATLTTVLRVQKLSFYIDAAFACRVFAIPLMAGQGYGALSAIATFCLLSVLYHLAIFATGLRAALRYDNDLAMTPASANKTAYQTGLTYG